MTYLEGFLYFTIRYMYSTSKNLKADVKKFKEATIGSSNVEELAEPALG